MDVVNQIVMVPVTQIKPYHRNVRKNDVTVEKLMELIPLVGFNVPLLLDRKNVIVKGHSRWKAAIRLGMESVPCVYTDADEETLKLDRIADNKVQEFTKWDIEGLTSELASLNLDFDLASLNLKVELPSFEIPGSAATEPAPEPALQPAHAETIKGSVFGVEPPQHQGPPPAATPTGTAPGDTFITPEDIQNTVPMRPREYTEVACDKCGHHMWILNK